ncbi:MAG: hypothetical protein SF339_03765 [Blastocatellia bacterium]|nr:hypothetical protein [Blastocatellia bacterium]
MQAIFLSLAILFFGVSQQPPGIEIDAAKLPMEAAAAEAFVPAGWMIEAETTGDLNKDGVPDLAIKLVEVLPPDADKENPPERRRALLLLLTGEAGTLRRVALANKVLQCTRCGGAFYGVAESPANVVIENGVVIVRQEYGSRELTEETLRFRHDPVSGRFVFIGMDRVVTDRMTALTVSESSNFLTGVKLITKERYDEKRDRKSKLSAKRERLVVKKRFIEEVEAASF